MKGIPEAIEASPAIKLCFMNLMWQPGETIDFKASDHVQAMQQHAGGKLIDVVAAEYRSPLRHSCSANMPPKMALPVENDIDRLEMLGVKVIARPLAALGPKIRHDPALIAEIAVHLAGEGRRRRLRALKSGK